MRINRLFLTRSYCFFCLIFSLSFSNSFSQTIDLNKPVGTTPGQAAGTATGGVSYTIPIEILKGTNGMEPKVNLIYNSQSGEGIAGFGWNISAYSMISRQGNRQYYDGKNTPVSYLNSNDAFLLDGQHLFPITGNNGDNNTVYGTENETFSKIVSVGGTASSGPDKFEVTTKDGMILIYGSDANSRMLTENGQSVMFWLLKKVKDKSGNYQEYKYSINQTDRTFALTEINYTGNENTGLTPYNKVELLYNYLPNWQNRKTFEGGASLISPFLLDKINIKNSDGVIVKNYKCSYTTIKNQSFLSSFTETGSDGKSLNPLTFQYGVNTNLSDVNISQYSNRGGTKFTGDLTGEGHDDIISVMSYRDNNNILHDTSYNVVNDFLSSSMSPIYSCNLNDGPSRSVRVVGYYASGPVYQYGNKNFVANDFDGDGKADVLMVSNDIFSNTNLLIFNSVKINYSRKYSGSSPTYQTVIYPQIPHVAQYYNDFKYINAPGTDNPSYFISGDFDGDGAQDYILILSNSTTVTNSYKAFFSSPARNIINEEILGFGVGGNSSDPFYATTVATASVITAIDFDGDGKQEILVQKPGASYILSVFPVSAATGYNYAASVVYTFTSVLSGYRIFPGDFNGDGKTDLLVRTSATNATAPWNILFSTGKEYKSYPFIFQNRPYLDGDNGGSAHHILLADFNNDGKTDIWHALDLTSTSSKHTLYISNGVPLDNNNSNSSFSIYNYMENISINRDQTVQSVFGDFDSDGKPDILSIKGATAEIIYPQPGKQENLMISTSNGLGAQTIFGYNKGYNRSDRYEYDDRSAPIGGGVNGNPYTVLKAPMYVLALLGGSDGSFTKITFFQYEDAIYHPLRGFLGFKKVTSTDWFNGILGTNSIVYSELNTEFKVPVVYKTTTGLSGSLLTETNINTDLIRINPANYFDKRFVSQLTKRANFDFITGAASETTNTYDSYANITVDTVKVGPFSGTTITPMETIASATSFVSTNTPVPSLPATVTITKNRNGQPSVSKTAAYTYSTNGLLATFTDFSGTDLANTLSYTYDNFGNVQTQTSSVSNTPVITNTYDTKGRYLMRKSASGSGINKTETYTYNSLNDNVATATGSDGLTTSFTFDGFGNITKTDLPDGNAMVNVLSFDKTIGRYSKTSYRFADTGLWNKTYYDIMGREIRKENKGLNDTLIFSTTEYNQMGLVYKKTQPRYSTELSVEVTYSYDQFQRLTSASDLNGTTTYSYSLAPDGQFTTTVTNGAGQTSSKTIDASGKVIKTNDNGGQLDFTYDSWGNQKEVKLGNINLIENTYDSYGRHTSLTDKNAGIIIYEYNALGKLTKQRDTKNNIDSYLYDAFGRVLSKTTTDGSTLATTSYTYYNNSGKVNDNITSITGFAGDVNTFQYDNLQRLQSENTTIDGISVTKNFEYDSKGDLIKTTYSSGLSISDTYDNNGILTQTSMTYGGVTKDLFTANTMNGLGIYTSYNYGNGKVSTLTYNPVKGVPTRYYTPGIQDLNLDFDANTGNLISRNDAIKGLKEIFTYDNVNRLTGASVNNVQQFAMTYDNNSGNSAGNIQTKSDIGNYRYDAQKINAVRFITTNSGVPTAPPNVISVNTQEINYTPFLKASAIKENGYELAYTYGQDEQRIKSVLKQNGNILETKYYFGSYEKQTNGGLPREIHYVNSGSGLCAIIVVESGIATPYFVYSDHLGSLLTITNSAGTIVAEQNFDAWGRNRNPVNWTYASVPSKPEWLYRGFTGHEHLSKFGLINMNGRMYDPVTCRMLSPDNYVPLPWNTQGYNGYSYANNNPLIYSDPDGNFFFLIPIIVGAMIGAGTAAHSAVMHGTPILEGALKGAIVGAAGGAIGGGLAGSFAGWGMVGAGIAQGAITGFATGGLNSALNGTNILKGAANGALWGGLIGGATGALNRLTLNSDDFTLPDADDRVTGEYFKSTDELHQYINQNIGKVDAIEKGLNTNISLAAPNNLPSSVYRFEDNMIYKGSQLIGGTTSPANGWFSKLTSRIRISPGIKGYFYNNVNVSQMTISHELLHATHLFLHLPGYNSYTERAAYAYNLAYAKTYGMESLFSDARKVIGYYPKEYSWRFLSLFINMGIQ